MLTMKQLLVLSALSAATAWAVPDAVRPSQRTFGLASQASAASERHLNEQQRAQLRQQLIQYARVPAGKR